MTAPKYDDSKPLSDADRVAERRRRWEERRRKQEHSTETVRVRVHGKGGVMHRVMVVRR